MSEVARRCVWCDEPQVKVGSATHRILDLLTSDPGFSWTPREVANRLELQIDSARKALRRLADDEVIRVRRHRRPNGWLLRYSAPYKVSDRTWPPTLTRGYLCSCGDFLPNPHNHPIEVLLDNHERAHLSGAR